MIQSRRLPMALISVGSFVLGAALGPIASAEALRIAALILGIALLGVGIAVGTPRIQMRIPALQSNRARLARLLGDTANLRANLRLAYKGETLVRSDWDYLISELDTRIFAELKVIMPDDWRPIRQSQPSFPDVNLAFYGTDQAWGNAMLDLLLKRRMMLEDQLGRYPPDP